jgi:hypothetical protein
VTFIQFLWVILAAVVAGAVSGGLAGRFVELRSRAAAIGPTFPSSPAGSADTITLFLMGPTGDVRHEIAIHQHAAPETYFYGGVTYRRQHKRKDGDGVNYLPVRRGPS